MKVAQSSEEPAWAETWSERTGTCHLATAAIFRRERRRAGWQGVCLGDWNRRANRLMLLVPIVLEIWEWFPSLFHSTRKDNSHNKLTWSAFDKHWALRLNATCIVPLNTYSFLMHSCSHSANKEVETQRNWRLKLNLMPKFVQRQAKRRSDHFYILFLLQRMAA